MKLREIFKQKPKVCPYVNRKVIMDNFGHCTVTDTLCYDIENFTGCYFKRRMDLNETD